MFIILQNMIDNEFQTQPMLGLVNQVDIQCNIGIQTAMTGLIVEKNSKDHQKSKPQRETPELQAERLLVIVTCTLK